MINRKLYNPISDAMANDLILVIVGARQTGKTTILRQLYKDCLQHGKTAHFINLERLDYVALLNKTPENIFSILPLPPKVKGPRCLLMRSNIWTTLQIS